MGNWWEISATYLDGNGRWTGLRPVYKESDYEWVTHEAVISSDEVAVAIMDHRKIPNSNIEHAPGTPITGADPGQEAAWGLSGTRGKPTGLVIVNLRTREMTIAGQTPSGNNNIFSYLYLEIDGKKAILFIKKLISLK